MKIRAYALLIGIAFLVAVAQEGTTQSSIQPVIKSPSRAGEVSFPHRMHFEEFEIACTKCHHETNAAALKSPHADYFDDFWIRCKICHRESSPSPAGTQSCSNCHGSFPASAADQTLSAKVVIHKSCWDCHEIGTGAEASRNCRVCHTGPKSEL